MGCFSSRSSTSKTSSPIEPPPYQIQNQHQNAAQRYQEPQNLQQQVLLQIPGCRVHLMDEGESIELANGEFILENILDENISLATIIKVGDELQWPLTKDEPVVKLDALHYLFSLPMHGGDPLSYGVTFPEQYESNLGFLDSFLKEHSCFSGLSTSTKTNKGVDWKEYAPRMDDYNNVLAKAIAGGTGQIVKGIFMCSNGYTNQKSYVKEQGSNSGAKKKSEINKSLKRVRKLSKMTSKLSKTMLDGVGIATGSVMRPVVKSQAGKAFFAMVPGQVLLASLDAVNKILDAAEVAEKQALSATSGAATRMVSNRFGESAGEATEHVFATAGHCTNTAWNIFKIRKAINPASSVSTGVLKNTTKSKSRNS
ncbi:senescence/dehydration-associated protein At4g35985, chloroplastic-like isoform X2 [Prunus avium]|uniref:Senescence/dehydration-associated protein At4g35985, chloroplastic-like isoform X2 n=1 Tax=Prunus avium TaxID=42229 RepID=A0A6P5S1E6_PRUAV|nr:senescence/dehydration-associated protein At4g35985, chloroplastic-like isoform X2 [Prunus avium]